jgi:hypothetical protein
MSIIQNEFTTAKKLALYEAKCIKAGMTQIQAKDLKPGMVLCTCVKNDRDTWQYKSFPKYYTTLDVVSFDIKKHTLVTKFDERYFLHPKSYIWIKSCG